jgi:hypothetical protein
MSKAITIRAASRDAGTGEVIISVGKSRTLHFSDLKAMNDSFDEASEREELLVGMLVAWAKRQPSSTWRDCAGKTITIDLDAADGVIMRIA